MEADEKRGRTFEVRVPASTSNLGSGFDCFGLALQLYLTVRGTVAPGASTPCHVQTFGEDETDSSIEQPADNLIFRAMRLAADREGLSLPPVNLVVDNPLPLGRGLGSSAAAIIAGISLCSSVCDREIPAATMLRYAFELEGHADNVAAAFYGGFVVACVSPDGSVRAVRRRWPPEIKVIVVSPNTSLKTVLARSALPLTVDREDAVYNLQRTALFGAALEAGAYDLLWEAMQDRLHQSYRHSFVSGLEEALTTPRQDGLLGIALSGSGPSIVALANDRYSEIAATIAERFRRSGTETTTRVLAVDKEGLSLRVL